MIQKKDRELFEDILSQTISQQLTDRIAESRKFKTVKRLRIAELLRPQNSKTVSVIRYTWNGRERVLDEQ